MAQNKNKANKQSKQSSSGKKDTSTKAAAQQKKKQTTEAKKKCGCCKWTLGSILLIGLIAAALHYDTNVNGKGVFAKSATGKALDNAGLLPYVEKGWYKTMTASARGYKWAEKTVPPYAKPIGKLCCDLYKMGRNAGCNAVTNIGQFLDAKLPLAAKFVDQYVPGLSIKIENLWKSGKTLCVNSYSNIVSCIQTNILVGRFAPDNLNNLLNNTRNAVLELYTTFHKKVDYYAKLK